MLTLKSIQVVGNNGTSALPATTFTYGKTRGTATEPNPGWNRLLSVDNGYGGKVAFTYEHIWTSAQKAYVMGGPWAFRFRVSQALVESGPSGQSYRTDTLSTYAYDEPALNERTYSAMVWYATYPPSSGGPATDYLTHRELSEFRGHAAVTVKTYNGATTAAPLLAQTKHWFYQGDAEPACTPPLVSGGVDVNSACFQAMLKAEGWRGRASKVEEQNGSGAALRRTTNTFTRTELPFYQSNLTSGYRLTGLWRAFNPQTQTVVELLEGGATASRRTTTSGYNLSATADGGQYGNLLSVEERDQNNAVIRTTAYSYATREDTTTYLVDRLWQELTRNGANGILALTHMLYDGQNTTAKALGTRGLPTRTLGYANLNAATTLAGTYQGQDMVTTYDVWGNELTTTTYAGYGSGTVSGSSWSYSAPGGGSTARTTTTTYNDNSLHVFPTQLTYPTVGSVTLSEQAAYDYRMGTLTSVTDANAVVTSATYDVFGRLDKLIRAGDSTTNPTEDVDFYDTEKPFRVLVKQRETAGSSAFRPVQRLYDGLGRLIQEKTESLNVTASAGQNIVTDTRYNGLGLVSQSAQPRYVTENSTTTFYTYTPVPGSGVNWTTTAYDLLQRPLSVTAPDSTVTSSSYAVDGALLMGATQTVDARGHKTRHLTDALGRLRKAEEYSGASPSWSLYASTTYEYDGLDRLTVVTDQKGNLSAIGYDSLGRKGTLLDPDTGAWAYLYDPNGNLIRQTDSRGQRVCFFYDALHRLTGKHYNGTSDTCPGTPTTITYSYDAFTSGSNYGKGRQTGMVSPDHSVAWKYNARGQIKEASHSVAGVTRLFAWTYDSADRLRTLTYPAIGANPAEQVTYTYDAGWRPTSLCAGPDCYVQSGATWTALGQPDEWRIGPASGGTARQDWIYDSQMQRLQQLRVFNFEDDVSGRFDRSYAYDAVGNVATIANHLSRQTHRFTYDHRDRLTRAWITNDASAPVGPAVMSALAPADPTASLLGDQGIDQVADSAGLPDALPGGPPAPDQALDTPPLPLAFVPNAGQTDAEVRYTTRGQGGSVFFTESEVVFALVTRPLTETAKLPPGQDPMKRRGRAFGVLRLQFEGADKQPQLTAHDQLPGQASYFRGPDPASWYLDLATYQGITYEQLYPGIGLRYEGIEGQLKSTYTVAPGADPSMISWRYKGAQTVAVDGAGNLHVTVPVKEKDPLDAGPAATRVVTVTEQAPVAWQEVDGVRRTVDVQFSVGQNERVGFTLGQYDPAVPLIIDPIVSYGHFRGESGSCGNAIAVDSAGNSYIAGVTYATDFPRINPLPGETGLEGLYDACLLKVNATGTAVLYSTYLGGNAGDEAWDIAVDATGSAYVVGETSSTNFPLMNAYQTQLNRGAGAGRDFFVAKVSPTGNSLTYSTYLGGGDDDIGMGLALDSSGRATVTGAARSTNFPTLSAPQASNAGDADAVIAQLNAAGSALTFSTYLGGSGYEGGRSLAVDTSGNVAVTGNTRSTNFPLTNAQQTVGTGDDGFVARLNPSGTAYSYRTYLGGSQPDQGTAIAADSSGNVYVAGTTDSSDFPTLNPIQATIGSTLDSDAFVTKLSPSGTRVWSTFLGGRWSETARSIAVDSAGQVYVAGDTRSKNYPVFDPLRSINGGGDGFLTVLTAAGTGYVASTYLGGVGEDSVADLAVNGSGHAFLLGSCSADFLAPLVTPPSGSACTDFLLKLLPGGGFDQSYSYDELGNLTNKAGVATTYGANGNGTGVGPHQARSVGGQSYSYDSAGHLLSGGGRTFTWNAEGRLTQVEQSGLTETYGYDGRGERVKTVAGGTTTLELEGLWEERLGAGAAVETRYRFGGQLVAVRASDSGAVTVLASDHLGSLSLALAADESWASGQDFDPWGAGRMGTISATRASYTGQQRDGTGLLYYHARYYDPVIGRFLSADTVVPGNASGSMDGVAIKPLTVSFHEPQFLNTLNQENRLGFWFQLSDRERQQMGSPWGPANPQALNRYSYVQNNPLKYTDPSGYITFSIGISIAGGLFLGGSYTVGVIVDTQGNIAQFTTKAAGNYIGVGAGIGVTGSLSNASTIFETAGHSVNIGFDAPQGNAEVSIGIDDLRKSDAQATGVVAISSGAGPYVGADVHVEAATTTLGKSFRLQDMLRNVIPKFPNPVKERPVPLGGGGGGNR